MLRGISREDIGTRSTGTITREQGSGRKKKMETKVSLAKGKL